VPIRARQWQRRVRCAFESKTGEHMRHKMKRENKSVFLERQDVFW
jgi:hypothetical protein